jgi:dinuclear metal center YbgI/SA1388 family protein
MRKDTDILVSDLLRVLERLAPWYLAQSWDNSGLQVGDEAAPVRSVLVSLELTEAVLAEAVAAGHDTVLTHHPLLFAPVRSLVESHPRERLIRGLVAHQVNLIACHTNLDAAAGGLAELAAEALGLSAQAPLEEASAGWFKFVGFVPPDALDRVAAAVFAAGAGGIGNYSDCAFAAEGTGWFTPGVGSDPAVGEVSRPERAPEVRWETVAPKTRLAAVVRAFSGAHPYEEPAFDLYPVEDVLPRVGLGRVGSLPREMTLRNLAENVALVYESPGVAWSGDGGAPVRRVAVLPGSGRGSLGSAAGRCDVLITGDIGYHDAEEAAEKGLSLIDVPHGDLEWWAFKRWAGALGEEVRSSGVAVALSEKWRAPWRQAGTPEGSGSPHE